MLKLLAKVLPGMRRTAAAQHRPRVVVLGTGWGALSLLSALDCDAFEVTLVSPRNFFLMTPLLASTTVGTLNQRSIIEPIRNFVARQGAHDALFLSAEAKSIDFANSVLQCAPAVATLDKSSTISLPYDLLICAVGCESATFGIPGVREHAIFMKEIEHSYAIRDRILDCLEAACLPGVPDSERERLLHFVVVGGGPSGVEFAAELHDFVKNDVAKHFPPNIAAQVKLTLIEASAHLLSMFNPALVEVAESTLKQHEHIELLLSCSVQSVSEKSVTIKRKDGSVFQVPFGCLVWVAGTGPRPVVRDSIAALGPEFQRDRRGLQVDKQLRVNGVQGKNVWALGDCAVTGLAATAQVASQQGSYLARLLNESKGDANLVDTSAPFAYKHAGTLAYVGDFKAVAQLPSGDWSGQSTYVLWRTLYLSRLFSWRNRLLVAGDWGKTLVFGRDSSRG